MPAGGHPVPRIAGGVRDRAPGAVSRFAADHPARVLQQAALPTPETRG